ncbi:MAG: D-amino acid dehydrogenase [Gammaproteobacteria bacterium]|nr:D-amino acid dehydrogenase [Gammaproteobacteria bacterium]
MRVVVIGAGVVGVTAAWHLARDGHEVTVLDRREGPGLEASLANGGQISSSHAVPWSSPKVPGQLVQWLGRPDAPLKLRLRADREQIRWCLRFLRECLPSRHLRNAANSLRLALFSRLELDRIRAETGIDNEHLERGILRVYSDEETFAQGREVAAFLAGFDVRQEILHGDELLRVEPALEHAAGLVGGVYAQDDQSGDAYLFTKRLADDAARNGVTFRYGLAANRLEVQGGRVVAIATAEGPLDCEAVVLSAGSHSAALVRPLGIDLPVYPVKGYSVTLPVIEPAAAPEVSLTDDARKIVISRLGDRLRAAGTAEITGHDNRIDGPRAQALLDGLMALLPRAGDANRAEFWTGLRPMTPDGPPVLGATPIANLYLNTGHGTLGWTMAAGSARLLAEIIAGRTPAIELDGLCLDRY